MRKIITPHIALAVSLALILYLAPHDARAQTAPPLWMQGASQTSGHSAAAIGAGGTSVVAPNNISTMFRNPAMLTTIDGIQVSVGGTYRAFNQRQTQQYAPVRYYPNLSLLLEGMTDLIPDPDFFGFTPADSVQRPFDNISPNWSRDHDETMPLQIFVAVPVELGGVRLVAGIGVAEYGDFGYYYQNNNAVTPEILSQRPLPMPRPSDGDPLDVSWYQAVRSRTGSVMGYGGTLAIDWLRHNVSFGVSGQYVSGTTDDIVHDVDRGMMTFFANYFRVSERDGEVVRSGTSDFSGFDLALSTAIRTDFVTVGLTVRPPMTLSRSFDYAVTSTGGGSSREVGEDELRMPWRGHAGIAVQPQERFSFGLEYEIRPYGRASFTDASGAESRPWLSSGAFRAGADVNVLEWLDLRLGMSRQADPYGAEGRPIADDPIWHTSYSAGLGFAYAGATLNLAYQSGLRSYEDVFSSAVYLNRDRRQAVVADLVYTFNWP